jgi:flagellar assembly protein FliH
MSSFPSREPVAPAAAGSGPDRSAAAADAAGPVAAFLYTEAVLHSGQHNFPLVANSLPVSEPAVSKEVPRDDARLEAEWREAGRKQGAAEMRVKFEEQVARERGAVNQAVGDFSRERQAYYQRIEEEAVRLALGIARKILHREAQVDPQLLMAIVSVALRKIEGATEISLRVNPQRAAEWRRVMECGGSAAAKTPEIVEDASVALEEVVLRTSMGTVDLGMEAQLKEIENGLTDLLAARPRGES